MPISKKLQETITNIVMQFEADSKKPVFPDPGLPQIPGYSHIMIDENTHRIIKCNQEGGVDNEFQPIEFPDDILETRKAEFQSQLLDKTTNFLKSKYGVNFSRLIQLEISKISESGIGFEEMWRNKYAEDLYIPSSVKKWDPKEVHLYIIWRSYYRFNEKKKEEEPKKLSELTIGKDESSEGSILTEEGSVKREDGEIVLCLPEGCLSNLTKETSLDYLAIKSLSKLKLIPTKEGFTVKTAMDGLTVDAKERLTQIDSAAREKLESLKKDADLQLDKMVTDVKGAAAKRKEEFKRDLSELVIFLKQLLKQAGEVVSRMLRLPQISIVTTPTGPGVAINAIITELDNLAALAAGLTALIEQIEAKVEKLDLEKYSKKIDEVATAYATITNILSMARAAVALIGRGV